MTTPRSERGPLEANLRWAFRWTFGVATGFSSYVSLLAIQHGSAWFPAYNLSLWAIIAGYYGAAFMAGVALAILRPLGRTRLGAYILGAVVGYLAYASVGVLVIPGPELFLIAAIPALVTGGLGVVIHDDPSPGSTYSPTIPRGRLIVYAIALIAALVLLWLDLSHHLVNR